jgi:tetratricopeptide (TPR) repeat protein
MMKRIFISYSHEDEAWKDLVKTHLGVLEKAERLEVWDDRKIGCGDKWYPAIDEALLAADAAVLLISADFLTSDFILKEEVPRLLQRRDKKEMNIFPLIVRPCAWDSIDWLVDMQVRPYEGKPLSTLPDHQAEAHLTAFVKEIDGTAPGDQASQKPPPLITLSKMPTTAAEFLGREEELTSLDEAWVDETTHVVCLVAWGGVGKTALVNEWLARMGKDNFRGAERVYAWSFYSQGTREDRQVSSDLFINDALTFFGDPNPEEGSPWDKGRRLADLIKKYKTLLILDGLEPIQYPPGEMQGRLKDQSMQALLKELCHSQPGLCVITTRLRVTDLQHEENRSCLPLPLFQLSPETGARLLTTLGIAGTDKELKEAVKEYRGHALALRLLAGYLKVVHDGDIRKRDRVPRLMDEEQEGGHAERVMAAYEKFLSGSAELNILYILGLFDRPAPPGAIETLRQEPVIAGLTDALQSLTDPQWKYALSHLRDLHLLAPPESHRENTLDCHPLVREYFAARLQQAHPKAWKEAHRRLYHYYKDLPEKEQPDTLAEMEPLFAAVSHGCRAGLHQEALDEVYKLRILRRSEHFSWKKLRSFGSNLAALSGFFETTWDKLVDPIFESDKGFILGQVGLYLQILGRLREAEAPMVAGLAARIKQKNWRNAARAANNISGLWLTLGEVADAIKYALKGMDYADRSDHWEEKMIMRTTLADGLHQAGNVAEAEERFREAEAIMQVEQPKYPFLYSTGGFQFCDLLLSRGLYKKVRERAEKALEIVLNGSRHLLDIALNKLSLGRTHLQEAREGGSGDFERAAGFLDQAVTGLREAGYQEFIPRGLLARAGLYREMGDYEKAWADLKEAQEIAVWGEMKLHLTDYHLEAARLCGAEGKEEEARGHLERAKALIEETGYRRRLPEIKNSLQIAKQPLQNAKRRSMKNAK